MLDTTREVEVPEGITLSLPVAGAVSRALAFFIDVIIRWSAMAVIIQILAFFGNFGTGLYLLAIFLIEWFYPVLFEIFYHGQTIGKKVMDIMVVNDDGTPIDWSSSIVRNLLRFADFLPFLYLFGLISMLFSRDFKRLGDFAAGTLVVHKLTRLSPLAQNNLSGLAPKMTLTLEEQSAIIGFSERSERMSESRLNELAGHLRPWLNQSKLNQNESASMQLKRMAKWLRGHA